jgi:hypothetical protein
MKKLLIGAWVVFALDLVVLGLMVREIMIADFGGAADAEAARAYAVTVTIGMAVWICAINAILVVSWLRESRSGLWVAIVCGAIPLMWAWTAAVQAISDVASAPQ